MKTYRSTQAVSWVNEGSRLLVVDEARSAVHVLSGADAALWRWLHQNLTGPEVCELFSALLNVSPEDGAAQVEATAAQIEATPARINEVIECWAQAGLLEVVDG
jgi:hypothetical protein